MVELTTPSMAGSVVSTAPVKIRLKTILGLLGSGLKMWCISGSFPYRRGFPVVGMGIFGSIAIFKEKMRSLYPCEDPKDPSTRCASTGFEDLRS